jgi:hypothetical protein
MYFEKGLHNSKLKHIFARDDININNMGNIKINEAISIVEAFRDNYLRQLAVEGRPTGAIRYISGKLAAAEAILDELKKASNGAR